MSPWSLLTLTSPPPPAAEGAVQDERGPAEPGEEGAGWIPLFDQPHQPRQREPSERAEEQQTVVGTGQEPDRPLKRPQGGPGKEARERLVARVEGAAEREPIDREIYPDGDSHRAG